MSVDALRAQFLTDVIMPLCDQYSRDAREGWHAYNAAYYEHRRQHGSLALCPDREARMEERIGFMMVQFFKWLYDDSALRDKPLTSVECFSGYRDRLPAG